MMLTHIIILAVGVLLGVRAQAVGSVSHEVKALDRPSENPRQAVRPVITSSSSRLRVLIGSTVVFPCNVRNLGSNVVVWMKAPIHVLFSGSLRVDNDASLSIVDDNSLKIRSVTPEHAGKYICQVRTVSPVEELSHNLDVLVPPKIKTDPSDGHVVVRKDDSVTLKCHAEGYPPPMITWSTLEGSLPRGIPEKRGNTLTIPSADTYHARQYQCKADNEIGDPVTAIFKVRVLYSPEIKVKQPWVHAGFGSSVEFSCMVAAEPSANISWTSPDGSPLFSDGHVSILTTGTSSRVKVKAVREEDFGSYNCSASNSLGTGHQTVEVSGLAKPVIFRSNSTGEHETSFLLSWEVTSYSTVIEYMLRIRKRKEDGVDEPPEPWIDVIIPVENPQIVRHLHSYNVTGLEPASAYEAVMQARNEFGWNHPSDIFTFYTYGRDQPQDVLEEQPLAQTTLLHPTTDRQEGGEVKEKEDILEVEERGNSAASHRTLERNFLIFIAFLTSAVACKL